MNRQFVDPFYEPSEMFLCLLVGSRKTLLLGLHRCDYLSVLRVPEFQARNFAFINSKRRQDLSSMIAQEGRMTSRERAASTKIYRRSWVAHFP